MKIQTSQKEPCYQSYMYLHIEIKEVYVKAILSHLKHTKNQMNFVIFDIVLAL